jgi:hypothetical protein
MLTNLQRSQHVCQKCSAVSVRLFRCMTDLSFLN